MKKAFFALGGSFWLAGCTASGPPCKPTVAVTLTSYFDAGGTPFVMSGVDGTPAALLFDTGSTTSFLSPGVVQQAGLQLAATGGSLFMIGEGGPKSAGLTYVDRFQLGTAMAPTAQFVVMDMGGRGGGFVTGEEGDIGNDFLQLYDIYLDLPDNKIALYTTAGCSAVIPPWPGPAIAIPLTIGYYGEVYLPITVDGRPMTAMLDTGTTFTTIPHHVYKSSGLSADAPVQVQAISVAAIGGAIPETLLRFKDMTVGGVHIANPVLAVVLPANSPNGTPGKPLGHQNAFNPFLQFSSSDEAILGEDYIATHRIFISHATSTMFVQP